MTSNIKYLRNFLAIKVIPMLFWSAPPEQTTRPPFICNFMLFAGFVVFGTREALLIAASAGESPLTVFAQGLTIVDDLCICTATFTIGFAILVL